LRDQLREAVQQEVGRVWLVRRRRSGADSPRDLAERTGARKLARSQSGAPRMEVGLARKVDVERLELPRGLQQLRSGAAGARGRGDPTAYQIEARTLTLIQRPCFGCGQHTERCVERTG